MAETRVACSIISCTKIYKVSAELTMQALYCLFHVGVFNYANIAEHMIMHYYIVLYIIYRW